MLETPQHNTKHMRIDTTGKAVNPTVPRHVTADSPSSDLIERISLNQENNIAVNMV